MANAVVSGSNYKIEYYVAEDGVTTSVSIESVPDGAGMANGANYTLPELQLQLDKSLDTYRGWIQIDDEEIAYQQSVIANPASTPTQVAVAQKELKTAQRHKVSDQALVQSALDAKVALASTYNTTIADLKTRADPGAPPNPPDPNPDQQAKDADIKKQGQQQTDQDSAKGGGSGSDDDSGNPGSSYKKIGRAHV